MPSEFKETAGNLNTGADVQDNLSPAGQAAAAVLALDTNLPPEIGVRGFQEAARAVVAAVRPLIEAETLNIQAAIYQATPDRATTYDEVGDQLSQHAAFARQDHIEARLREAARHGRTTQ